MTFKGQLPASGTLASNVAIGELAPATVAASLFFQAVHLDPLLAGFLSGPSHAELLDATAAP